VKPRNTRDTRTKVLRGGCGLNNSPDWLRTTLIDGYPPVGALRTIGFRTFRPTKLPVRRV